MKAYLLNSRKDTYIKLPTHLRKALHLVGIGGVLVKDADGTPAVYSSLPLDRQTVTSSPALISQPMLYLYQPEGPLVRFLVVVMDNPKDPFFVEIFLDPTLDAHRQTLGSMSNSNNVRFHIFGTDRRLLHLTTKLFNWSTEQCQEADRILKVTQDRTANFAAAKRRYILENPTLGFASNVLPVVVI